MNEMNGCLVNNYIFEYPINHEREVDINIIYYVRYCFSIISYWSYLWSLQKG